MKSTFLHEGRTKASLIDFISRAQQLSMGVECKKFESTFAAKQGRRNSIFVSSGSAANLGLLQALVNIGRLHRGDRVGFSALTWATNVMPIIQAGMIPVAVDCAIETLNASPETLEKIDQLDAFFITNVLGLSDDLFGIVELCKAKNVLLLEDNCESLGSSIKGKRLGNFGLASTFSFFIGHHLSTIEGGMICTDDDELADALVMVRAHGWDRNLSPEKQQALRTKYNVKDFFALYTFYDLAYNLRPTEIQGFLGNTQMVYWDEIVENREKNFTLFLEAASTNSLIHPLRIDHMETVSNFAMPVVLTTKEAFASMYKRFIDADIEIRPIVAGSITEQPFYRKYITALTPCPNAELVHHQGFYFPNNSELTAQEVRTLCNLLREV